MIESNELFVADHVHREKDGRSYKKGPPRGKGRGKIMWRFNLKK